MKPCLSEATTMSATFAEDVAAFADAGCTAMEVWLTKLEDHLQAHSPEATHQLLQARNVILCAAAYQGGLLLSQGEERRTHFDHFQRRLALCQEFGIGTLLVVPDFASAETLWTSRPEASLRASGLQQAVKSLKQAGQLASTFGVRLALEFRGDNAWCASLDTALAFVTACDEPNLGVCFDVFHYYTGPSKLDDLRLLTGKNLVHVQLCDLAGVPRELASDADRVLPGDGDFQLEPILEHFRRIGYEGWVSVELMNPELWKMKPVAVAEAAITALRRVLGLAGMGIGRNRHGGGADIVLG